MQMIITSFASDTRWTTKLEGCIKGAEKVKAHGNKMRVEIRAFKVTREK